MTVLDDFVSRRRAIHEIYYRGLSGVKGVAVMCAPSEKYISNYWLTCITLDTLDREVLRLALDVENIESRPLWKPMHLQPVFASAPFYGDGTSEKLFNNGLCLPSGASLTDEDIYRVIDVIKLVILSKSK